jgi:hypothetical protein
MRGMEKLKDLETLVVTAGSLYQQFWGVLDAYRGVRGFGVVEGKAFIPRVPPSIMDATTMYSQ